MPKGQLIRATVMNGAAVVCVENVTDAAIKKPFTNQKNVTPNTLEKHAYH
jgi:hypothetical protein